MKLLFHISAMLAVLAVCSCKAESPLCCDLEDVRNSPLVAHEATSREVKPAKSSTNSIIAKLKQANPNSATLDHLHEGYADLFVDSRLSNNQVLAFSQFNTHVLLTVNSQYKIGDAILGRHSFEVVHLRSSFKDSQAFCELILGERMPSHYKIDARGAIKVLFRGRAGLMSREAFELQESYLSTISWVKRVSE